MEWSDNELEELAAFFAKRMTPGLEPLDPTDPPPPSSAQADWLTALKTAREGGMLPTLARQIGKVVPDDENLQHACALLAEGKGASPSALMGAALSVGMALVLAGLGVYTLSPPELPKPELQPQSVTQPVQVAQVAPPAEDVHVAAVDVVPSPEAEEATVAVAEVEAPTQPDLVAKADVTPGTFQRCTGGEGEVVGYWYAGEEEPGAQGSTVTLTHAVNVRADYPDVHNRFDARSKVTCVLQEGDLVRLSRAAVKVPGNAYWVPLMSGDLTG